MGARDWVSRKNPGQGSESGSAGTPNGVPARRLGGVNDGGGRCEIEAAHIRAVQEKGPESPRNGIALTRTVHWLFDRHLVALEEDGRILQADKLIPEQ